MKKAWAWLKRWGAWILGVVLALVGAGWLWNRRKKLLGRVQDQLAVEKAKTEIARLKGARAEIARQVGEDDAATSAIDEKLLDNKRKIVEAHEGGGDLTTDQLEAAFAELGL